MMEEARKRKKKMEEAAAFTAAITAATIGTVEVTGQERMDVIQRYIKNPNLDDAYLYYNGICKADVVSFPSAQWRKRQRQQQGEKTEEDFPPCSSLMREKTSRLALPNHKLPMAKTSPKRNPLFQEASGKEPSSSPSTKADNPSEEEIAAAILCRMKTSGK